MPYGPGEVLDVIRAGKAVTRGDLLEQTGLSRMTVAQRIDQLLAERLIVEGLSSESTGGRRRRTLDFNGDRSVVAVASMDTTHTRIALTNLHGAVLAATVVEAPVTRGPTDTLDAVVGCMTHLLDERDCPDLCGLGISIPGPVDPETGRPSQPPIMPGWDGYPIAEHLNQALPKVPILTANDADASAMGEYCHRHLGARSMCLLKVSTGIGAGIVINGQVYRGADGGAGDIGHVRRSEWTPLGEFRDDPLCQCGAHGCLAAVASGRAVARALNELGIEAESGRDVGRLLDAGHADADRLTRAAGRRIGEVMAMVVELLNPQVVIVGGDLASPSLLAGIRETLYSLALPRATRHMTLQLGALGPDAAVVGLSRLVVDQEFSAEAVNARLNSAKGRLSRASR